VIHLDLVGRRAIGHVVSGNTFMKIAELLEATIKSVTPPSREDMSSADIAESFSKLSDVEKHQLGSPGYISKEDWPRFRKFLVNRSLASNPGLDPKLTAYTPGETLHLLNNPIIKSWHQEIVSYKVPDKFSIVAFVPCAKTKP